MNQHLDLYLLRCLVALAREEHVTRAAARMGTTQPAMSATLARLRKLLGDPLLVRTEKGMVPTPRALEAAASAQQALDLIDHILDDSSHFQPATAVSHFRVSTSETVGFLLMPSVIAALRILAPGVELSVQKLELQRVRQELEEGVTDLVIAFLRNPPAGLRSKAVMRQKMSVIAAAAHPSIQSTLSLEQYVRYPHVFYALGRADTSTLEGVVDEALSRAGVSRRVGASLPSTLASPVLVAYSDMLATVPERIARHFADHWKLQVLTPPVPLEDVCTSMFWHERMHNNIAHRWLRDRIAEIGRSLPL